MQVPDPAPLGSSLPDVAVPKEESADQSRYEDVW